MMATAKRKQNRLSDLQWEDLRKRAELGTSIKSLALQYGVGYATAKARSKKEGWNTPNRARKAGKPCEGDSNDSLKGCKVTPDKQVTKSFVNGPPERPKEPTSVRAMEKRLLEDGYKKTSHEWITAWDVPKPKAKPKAAKDPANSGKKKGA